MGQIPIRPYNCSGIVCDVIRMVVMIIQKCFKNLFCKLVSTDEWFHNNFQISILCFKKVRTKSVTNWNSCIISEEKYLLYFKFLSILFSRIHWNNAAPSNFIIGTLISYLRIFQYLVLTNDPRHLMRVPYAQDGDNSNEMNN